MPLKKSPRPASTYRGARRNALKRGEKLTPHRWQTKPNHIRQHVPPTRPNERRV